MNDRAGLFTPGWIAQVECTGWRAELQGEGMEADDLLCSRNARPPKDEKGSLAVLLLAERARSECARSTRAIEDRPGYP
jgi:hypothetical protein